MTNLLIHGIRNRTTLQGTLEYFELTTTNHTFEHC